MTVAIFIAPKLQSHFWRAGTIFGNVSEKMPIFWEFLLKMPPPKNVYSCQKSFYKRVSAVYRQFFNWFRCRRSVVALQPSCNQSIVAVIPHCNRTYRSLLSQCRQTVDRFWSRCRRVKTELKPSNSGTVRGL
ncbi:hypothetical protein A6769_38950 [Nostoc punctiforme NIES-2108]|uniref:Uncharacterized protein n=1 Tax=Nostoc punctiforme NIES-2108 TaxID=1356359 RepID=A0A367RWS9_NOSPU|nr:hypothetical protein A6769_38950 [Nostoc punctiforme NIES-2108]